MDRSYARDADLGQMQQGDWSLFFLHVAFIVIFNAALLGLIIWLFQMRWRVTY